MKNQVRFHHWSLGATEFLIKSLEMNYLSLLWLLIINKLRSQFKGIFPTACLTLRSSAIAFSCSFQRITGTDCSFDSLDKSKSLNFFLRKLPKDISNHCSHWSFSGVTAENVLIVARVGIYRGK